MKRSEMKLKLTRLLKTWENSQLNNKTSTEILDLLESLGMQPPPHQQEYGTGYADEFGNEATCVEWVQGWEQE